MVDDKKSQNPTGSKSGTQPPLPSQYSDSTDYQDSFYAHHSDSPSIVLVSSLFSGDNYGTWVQAIIVAFQAKNKLGFVDGTIMKPYTQSESRSGNTLKHSIASLKQDDLSVSAYFTKLKSLWMNSILFLWFNYVLAIVASLLLSNFNKIRLCSLFKAYTIDFERFGVRTYCWNLCLMQLKCILWFIKRKNNKRFNQCCCQTLEAADLITIKSENRMSIPQARTNGPGNRQFGGYSKDNDLTVIIVVVMAISKLHATSYMDFHRRQEAK
ncbi:hypothetical protein JRO89_XS07G0216200 [Xanthoceras sorbifolium]|uniref:Retrotransposon Copia-like N-terminal domain-containing protein n=1 Tax=Xanthoceras sorbifolium TaxID=99658 RepID=A0ABQ8HUH2_9ROSI|nr:hypothetical protein JRO89_XS07G0216200 [Xanthoceras sorbifolium]